MSNKKEPFELSNMFISTYSEIAVDIVRRQLILENFYTETHFTKVADVMALNKKILKKIYLPQESDTYESYEREISETIKRCNEKMVKINFEMGV